MITDKYFIRSCVLIRESTGLPLGCENMHVMISDGVYEVGNGERERSGVHSYT